MKNKILKYRIFKVIEDSHINLYAKNHLSNFSDSKQELNASQLKLLNAILEVIDD